MNANGGPMLS